jgi:hypothetical protein
MSIVNLNVAAVIVGSAFLFIIVSIPLLKGRVKMNRIYGVRFAQSFKSEEDWYALNRYGAQQLIFWSFVLIGVAIVALIVPMEGNPVLVVLFLLSPAIAACIGGIVTYAYARTRAREE